MVGPEVQPLQVLAALPAIAEPREKDIDVGLDSPVPGHQEIALRSAGFIDQARGHWPAGIVERRLVQRLQNAFEQL